ncbi:cell envelope-related transcriptional attenuator [Alkaliphilus metalliredigens QYMF]|uniref:Cell envelope-related transcriptional attenuator n=1 Tax=Alkaliphilus metalliredigens (strain QYMF) TaxID=293826 RepID=A6TJT4_ALKMQ|nr:LCP family protein [Alkaliphilus metalliredigens]ABR46452.1 cell envelope-related transcriptional attenuator [Alkaliphilus metalliredigens QYMF]
MNKNRKNLIALISIVSILLIIGSVGFQKYQNIVDPHQAFEKNLQQEKDNREKEGMDENRNVVKILLLGVDSSEVREGRAMGYRSDAIMIASMDLDAKNVKLVSIPRDSYTDVPGNDNKDKINHAMAFGGGPRNKGNQYAVEAVEGLLDINIDYYLTMDLDAVKDIVDTIGGVTVDVERSMDSGGIRIEKGEQKLDGQQVLAYLSNRNAPTGDFARIEQQQKFMKALFQQTKEKGKFSDVLPLYLKMQSKIFTNLEIDQMGALLLFLKSVQSENIELFTLRGEGMIIDGIYYIDIDEDYMKEIFS